MVEEVQLRLVPRARFAFDACCAMIPARLDIVALLARISPASTYRLNTGSTSAPATSEPCFWDC